MVLSRKALNKEVLKFKKLDLFGLALFVSIPLPITGAWTAVLINIIRIKAI